MKITVKELTTIGPTIHSSFSALPFKRDKLPSGRLSKPVLAYQTHSCIKIVGDIYRFQACQDSGQETVAAYLIQESESSLELLRLVIEYYSPMTLMDKALLTKTALELGVQRPILAEHLLSEMNLPPREKLIDQLLFLLKLPSSLQTFILEKDLSLKRALIFKRADQHLDWVEQLISNLKIGINMSAEIIQNIWEMSKRDGVDFKAKAEEMGLWEMAYTEIEDTRFAVIDIRAKINAARFPTLDKAGHDLSQRLAAINLPSQVKVKWDPYFEQQGVDISFHAKNDTELDDVIEKLSSKTFKDIFTYI
ncbi:MAG: hypothetical protein HQ507_04270 [Candidatus Marinimicrobia bacterium]|nr:hypothetical protein [Candidatus Neomarinimicrobiota bacterium]